MAAMLFPFTMTFSRLTAISFALLSALSCRANEPEKLPQLATVKTWGDLLAQKPVVLPKESKAKPDDNGSGPVTFRLGMARPEDGGYAVLYCLAQGDLAGMDQMQTDRQPCLGPFWIDVRSNHKPRALELQALPTDRYMMRHENALFIKAIWLEEGATTITIKQPLAPLGSDTHTAARDVSAVDVRTPAGVKNRWAPWGDPHPKLEAVSVHGDFISANVTNPFIGRAAPIDDGGDPIFFDMLPKAGNSLPEFIATKPDPGFQLTYRDGEIVARFGESGPYEPREDFLTRWWVNDKPFIPKRGSLPREDSKAGTGDSKEVHFQVEIQSDVLGVKKGDKIGLQLLYCPQGWEYTDTDNSDELASMQATPAATTLIPPPLTCLSNRVNFTYSGAREDAPAGAHPASP